MAALHAEVDRLLAFVSEMLPLTQAELKPPGNSCEIRLQDSARFFSGAKHADAAVAGLLLRIGCWKESHLIAQDIESVEGSYWHGIVHRMEPDAWNARYWFRRVGQHPIFPELTRSAADILETNGPKNWQLKNEWDPSLFVDWCEQARESGGPARDTAIAIQMVEWRLLFDWCREPSS